MANSKIILESIEDRSSLEVQFTSLYTTTLVYENGHLTLGEIGSEQIEDRANFNIISEGILEFVKLTNQTILSARTFIPGAYVDFFYELNKLDDGMVKAEFLIESQNTEELSWDPNTDNVTISVTNEKVIDWRTYLLQSEIITNFRKVINANAL